MKDKSHKNVYVYEMSARTKWVAFHELLLDRLYSLLRTLLI